MEMWFEKYEDKLKEITNNINEEISSEDIMNLIETGESEKIKNSLINAYGSLHSLIHSKASLMEQLKANNLAILEASFDPNLPKDITVKEFKIKHKDLFDEHERLEKLLEENKNEKL